MPLAGGSTAVPGLSVMVIVISNNVWPPSSPKGDVSQWALEYELTHWVNLAFKIRPVYYSVLQHLVQPTWTAQVFMSLICIVNRSSLQFTSVLPLCCYGKVLHFMMKKKQITKANLHTVKMRCNAKHRCRATHCKPETNKTGDSSNASVCTDRAGANHSRARGKINFQPPLIAYDVILFKQPFHDLFK